jgi:hypothetical protein
LGEEYKSFISSLCSLLHSPVTSSLLGPNILLNTLFSNTLSYLSSRNVSDIIIIIIIIIIPLNVYCYRPQPVPITGDNPKKSDIINTVNN